MNKEKVHTSTSCKCKVMDKNKTSDCKGGGRLIDLETKDDSQVSSSKPPYSYIALIAMAIRDSPRQMATLAEINAYLTEKYDFFRGSYKGWRNSIRHNLSLNECFVKILRDPKRPWAKDNYWILNPNSEYTFADGVFSRRRKRLSNERKGTYVNSNMLGERDQSLNAKPINHKSMVKKTGINDFSIENILRKPEKDVPQSDVRVDKNIFEDIPLEMFFSPGHLTNISHLYQNGSHWNYGFYPDFQSDFAVGNLLTWGATSHMNHYHPYGSLFLY